MGTYSDYLEWRGDLSFEQDGVNYVDMALLAMLPLLDLTGFTNGFHGENSTLPVIIDKFLDPKYKKPQNIGLLIPIGINEMLISLSRKSRYKDLIVVDYVRNIDISKEMQFTVATLVYKEKYTFVIFSGTDDTIIGWKENFNSIYENYSSASKYATEYLDNVAPHAVGDLYVFGHSKGGNLTLVSTLFSKQETYERITRSVSLDGQGINVLTDLTEEQIERFHHVHKVLPESSVVGRIYKHLGTYEIINSNKKGLNQHDPTSWEISGNSFIHKDRFSSESDEINELVDNTLDTLSMEDRKRLVAIVYNTLEKANISNLLDLQTRFRDFIQAVSKCKKEDVALVNKVIRVLVKDRALMDYVMSCVLTEIKDNALKRKN